MKKERIEELTLFRAMAFLAIVLQHCIAEFIYRPEIMPKDSVMLAMLFHFTRFGTPTFIFISGLLFFYNYYEKLNYRTFLIKRFQDILVPFIIWTGVYYTLMHGVWFLDFKAWQGYAHELIVPSSGYHLWFIVMIFQFYLLFPVFHFGVGAAHKRLKRLDAEREGTALGWGLAVLGLLFAGLLWLSYYVLPGLYARTDWAWLKTLINYRNLYFIFHAFYFVAGAAAALYLTRFRAFIRRSQAWNLFLFAAVYIGMCYGVLSYSMDKMNLAVSTYLKPSTFVLILSQQMIMYGIALKIAELKTRLFRVFHWIGTYSFGGFLAHPLAVWVLAPLTRSERFAGQHLELTAFFYAAVVMLSLGLSCGASLLPFGRWMMGPSRPAARSKRQERIKVEG
ncbi:acyltransferase [Paenibacillus gansuensis]|uniref:Acyltransferase n=1 Tax=Paenibacillus gansuensis TaxID=306542 RepID=A0ABW5PLC4_9BACL